MSLSGATDPNPARATKPTAWKRHWWPVSAPLHLALWTLGLAVLASNWSGHFVARVLNSPWALDTVTAEVRTNLCADCATDRGEFRPWEPSGHYMYRTAVTICTASLTFSNSTSCPHSVFTCFVWIWEQTAIISLYSINWLVFKRFRKIFKSDY